MRYLSANERAMSPRFAQSLLLTATVGALAVALMSPAQAEDAAIASQSPPTTVAANQPTTDAQSAAADNGGAAASTVPPFFWGANVRASEAYVSNASGVSGVNNEDYVSTLGADLFVHERSARVSFDASEAFSADFYAGGTHPAQIYNNLLALGSVQAIPDYLTINARAFASPVVTSNIGIVSAGGRVIPDGYRNSFGYYVEPVLTFRLGHFASSQTTASYGSTFYSTPAGSSPAPIPGLPGPQDTNFLSAQQTFSNGDDFERLSWTVIGSYNESKRRQGNLTQTSGEGNLRYALSHEFSLLASGGYDAINNSTPLLRDLSGPVIMGGFALTLGQNFSFQAEAGAKYNSSSYIGSLRYCLDPKASLVATVNDSVSTPEGQVQSGLDNLTSTQNGQLNSSNNLLCNGTSASLAGYQAQPSGNMAFDQNVARYQTIGLSFIEDFDRNHAALTLFGTRRTILSGVFVGPPRTNSRGAHVALSRDFSELMHGTVGTGYTVNEELGGTAKTFTADANLNYSLTRQMNIYFQAYYLDRQSSASLIALSPFTGNLTDYRFTIGLSRSL